MSDEREREHADDGERPEETEVDATVAAAEQSFEQSRHRPPDLVGTRPEWDPATLVPTETPRAAAGRLWAPAGEGGAEAHTAGSTAQAGAATQAAGAGASAAADGANAHEPSAPATSPPAYSRYSARFQFLFGALVAVAAAALVLLVAVVVGKKDDGTTIALRSSGPAWSTWQPSSGGLDAVKEIAEHVGKQYRLSTGKQLVIVTGGPMEFADFPATIAVQEPASQGGSIDLFEEGAVLYRLCGTNARTGSRTLDCTISGKPSTDRMLLLQREALELALYSFRYVGASEAVVLLPPAVRKLRDASGTVTTGTSQPYALFFHRSDPDVQAAINQPLRSTLKARTPTVAGIKRSPDSQSVSALTESRFYAFKFSMANQDARAFLLLEPLAAR